MFLQQLMFFLAGVALAHGIVMDLRGSADCNTKLPFCLDPELTGYTGTNNALLNGLSNESAIPLNPQGGWGKCLATDKEINAAWFWMRAVKDGPVNFALVSKDNADIDFIFWGPFDDLLPATSCGAALTSSKEIDCGWMRGTSILANEFVKPNSLEKQEKLNATAGKYYALLVNDQTVNGTTRFYLQPRGNNSLDSFDCTFLRDVKNFTINGTGNATQYGTMPVVGQPVTITFTGLFLDSRPGYDLAKTVLTTDFCNGSSAGADRIGDDLGPGDAPNLVQTTWTLSFLAGGTFKLCYRPFGLDWKELSANISVLDMRTRPPVRPAGAIPDALDTDTAPWFDFQPKEVVTIGPVEFTFYGFKVQAQSPIQVKAVVENCFEAFPSIPGMVPQNLTTRNTAKFAFPLPGRYRICMWHRAVWEIADNSVLVTTPDTTKVYNGYSSCEQLLANMPDYCGCFFDNDRNGTNVAANFLANVKFPAPVQLPVAYPMERVLASSGFPPINQGCCAHLTPVRQTMAHPTKLWGLCSEPSPVLQPNQCI